MSDPEPDPSAEDAPDIPSGLRDGWSRLSLVWRLITVGASVVALLWIAVIAYEAVIRRGGQLATAP